MAARASAKKSPPKKAAAGNDSPQRQPDGAKLTSAPGKKAAGKGPVKAAKSNGAGPAKGGRQEYAALRAELDKAHERIAELEKLSADVVNRLDWVIDSLRDLIGRKG